MFDFKCQESKFIPMNKTNSLFWDHHYYYSVCVFIFLSSNWASLCWWSKALYKLTSLLLLQCTNRIPPSRMHELLPKLEAKYYSGHRDSKLLVFYISRWHLEGRTQSFPSPWKIKYPSTTVSTGRVFQSLAWVIFEPVNFGSNVEHANQATVLPLPYRIPKSWNNHTTWTSFPTPIQCIQRINLPSCVKTSFYTMKCKANNSLFSRSQKAQAGS